MKLNSSFLLFFLLVVSVISEAQSADYIFINGKIFTSNEKRPFVSAVSIKGNKLSAAGNDLDIQKQAGDKTIIINLKGRTVVPGFNDAHFHSEPYSIGYTIASPQDGTWLSWQQLQDSIKVAVQHIPKGTFIYAEMGEEAGTDTSITRFVLDQLAPDHPLYLHAYWGHVAYFNSAALKALKLSETEADPKGGFFGRVPGTNRLNGRSYESAVVMLAARRPSDEKQFTDMLRDLGNQAAYLGLTTIQNMCNNNPPEEFIAAMRKQPLPIRFRLIRWAEMKPNGAINIPAKNVSKVVEGLPLVSVSGTKWVLDGTPIERLASTTTGYNDRKEWHGQFDFTKGEIRKIISELRSRNDQPLFHVVGDSTINFVLGALSKNTALWSKRSVRFEHSDELMPDKYLLAKRLSITVVQNPTHFSIVSLLRQRYDEHLLQNAMSMKSLLRAGIPIAIGSDGPLNPFLNIMFACMHPFRPSEALTVEEAVIAYTRGSASAEMQMNKGMLVPGQLADLVVLSHDIFTAPLQQLPATHSLLTMVDGKIIYQEGIK